MENFVLSCCSTCDLNKKYLEKRNISYLCFHYFLDGVEHVDDFGESIPYKEFYKKMVDGATTKTSQINVETYFEYFEKFIKEGKALLHLTLSSGISGTFNAATIAKNMILEKYKDAKIYVIDSLAASSGFGLLVDRLADLRDEGKTIDEVAKYCEENKLNLHHWFFSTDLTFYVKGGRVSKTSGFIGNMLHICPLLNVNNEGKLIPREKCIGTKKAISATLSKMLELANNGTNYNEKCFISHSDSLDIANRLASAIEEKFPNLKSKIMINDIGTTIGAHTGPGTVALFFWGKKREE